MCAASAGITIRAAIARTPWRRLLVGFVAALRTGVLVAVCVRLAGDWSQGLAWERAMYSRLYLGVH